MTHLVSCNSPIHGFAVYSFRPQGMILFGSGMGVLIEAWKVRTYHISLAMPPMSEFPFQITKAVDISVKPSPAGSRFPYRLDIKGM